jgi:putative heme-binding domain-containing protein
MKLAPYLMRRIPLPRLFFIFSVSLLILSSCKQESASSANAGQSTKAKLEKLKLPEGFRAEHLYSPSANEQGSWVSMTFDDKGRLITSDQYGALYRLEIPAIGTSTAPKIEKLIIGTADSQREDTTTLKIGMGYAQGLLYAFNSLYVMVNHNSNKDFDKNTGLYRLQDTDGDDQFDKITLLKGMKGEPGEHGPHSIILAPDKKSIYIAAGNHTDLPEMDSYRLPPVWKEDNLFPQIKDPRGHANNREAPGGWIVHLDSAGQRWELVSAGYRNEFDIAFNDAGDLFTYDSDMEWDFGMPWYRPTRICHVTSGSEFGWRTGNGKWSPAYPDNLPPVLNIGQGSPTNLIYTSNARFPEKYRNALLAFDWSFGIIYAIRLIPSGASYGAKAEEFLSGSPLPLTDGVIGPDGALYFLTGGRRLESDLYRVYYQDWEKVNAEQTPNAEAEINDASRLRRTLEKFHSGPRKGAVDLAWPNLKHEDRFVRYAARIVLEHQPVNEWQDRALKETDPQTLTQSMIALARHGKKDLRNQMLQRLTKVNYKSLSPAEQIDLLRAFELIFFRMGKPDGTVKNNVVSYLDANFPANANDLNRMLSKLLVYLEAPGAVKRTLALLEEARDDPFDKTVSASSDLILRNPQYGLDIAGMLSKVPPAQQSYYAVILSGAKSGWTPELHEKYFKWFANAFTYKGGRSYIGFVDKARQLALANVSKERYDFFNNISGDSLLDDSGNDLADLPQPKGPGRRWNMESASSVADSGLVNRNFEQGKMMFAATLCASCHTMRGEGGNIGPDLTQLGTRFTARDMLEAIIDPNKVVSDQYAATVFVLKDGSSVVGRLTNEDDDKYFISQNPFSPQTLREIPKGDVTSTKISRISVMMPGLINSLNNEELKDLLAYLMAGGNDEHELYKNKTQAKR